MATTIDAENAKQIRQSMDVLIQITPAEGDPIVITNENLIKCIVSLRSNLSRIDPTLPESEIEIEAFFDEDLSETLADVPKETPITYSAGYPGDMSPTRNFYLSEQIRWENNVLSIKGVDRVHLLDEEPAFSIELEPTLSNVYELMEYCLKRASIETNVESFTTYKFPRRGSGWGLYIAKDSLRNIIAELMWIFRTRIDSRTGRTVGSTHYEFYEEFFPEYVDAGIPRLRFTEQQPTHVIKEEDCGQVRKEVDKTVRNVVMSYYTGEESASTNAQASVDGLLTKVGSWDWYKGKGVFINPDEYTTNFGSFIITTHDFMSNYLHYIVYVDDEEVNAFGAFPVYVDGETEEPWKVGIFGKNRYTPIGYKMLEGNCPKDETEEDRPRYTQFVPWDATAEYPFSKNANVYDMSDLWELMTKGGLIEKGAESTTFDLLGANLSFDKKKKTKTFEGTGDDINVEVDKVRGVLNLIDDNQKTQSIFPDSFMKTIAETPRRSGSFVWKGDPRIQPRDRVVFVRLDGTQEVIKIENITLTHEGGGLTAEMNYRYDGIYDARDGGEVYAGDGYYAGNEIETGGAI